MAFRHVTTLINDAFKSARINHARHTYSLAPVDLPSRDTPYSATPCIRGRGGAWRGGTWLAAHSAPLLSSLRMFLFGHRASGRRALPSPAPPRPAPLHPEAGGDVLVLRQTPFRSRRDPRHATLQRSPRGVFTGIIRAAGTNKLTATLSPT